MMRKFLVGLTITATLALAGASAFAADATIDQVYQAAQAGKYAQAQQMMDQVLRDHPNSGKAHFVEAELLAKQGRIAGAKTELATAERLTPDLSFAKPGAVQELKSLLSNDASRNFSTSQINPAAAPAQVHPSIPWGLIAVVLAVLALVVFFFNRRSQTVIQAVPSGPNYGGNGFGYNAPAYGNGPMPMTPGGGVGGGLGSGILGGLATGAAVGAGVVAGEALMHRVFDGNGQSAGNASNVIPAPTFSNDWNSSANQTQNYDMGGNDFGLNNDASWDDSSSSSSDDDWN